MPCGKNDGKGHLLLFEMLINCQQLGVLVLLDVIPGGLVVTGPDD